MQSKWIGLSVLGMAFSLWAQSPEATVSGVVQDTGGAVIVGAEVSATNAETNTTVSGRTNDKGFYSLRSIPIGAYSISVEHPGFRRAIRTGLTLTTGQSLAYDVTLEIGAVTENITVSGSAALIETRTSDVSQLVESKTVEDIPLGDRRTMNIVNLTGAAVFVNYDSGAKPNFSLAGGRTQSQNFFIDGGTGQNMRLGIGQIDTDPPVETVQEVKILSNSFAAEYGGSAGGVIIATTKSGTNRFHGSLFEYLRNEVLDAGNFFSPFVNGEKVRAPLRYNVFGGTVGGPVIIPKLYQGRNKTFFFGSYEGSRRRDGLTDSFTVPTALQRIGDFSQTTNAAGVVIPVYDPATTRVESGKTLRDVFAGNRIPANRLDPVALKLIPFYPLPNQAGDATGANNFRSNYVQGLLRDNILAKVDHNFTDRDKFSARYIYNSDNASFTSPLPQAAADMRVPADRHQQFYYAAYTRVISPAIINEFRFTYANRINHEQSLGLGGDYPSKLGLKGVAQNAFPAFTITGYRQLGSGSQERRQYPIQQFQVINNTTWIRGRHAIKFGAEARPSFNYEVNLPLASGTFGFSALATGLPGNAASGNALASLLVGFPISFSSRETQVLDRSSWYLAAFAQDDWSVHRDLTLNMGLRWETDTPIRDRNNRMNGFDATRINPVSGTPGVVRFVGVDGFRLSPYDTDLNNFGPRFGFAWKPFGSKNTVVRGGFGIFFAHPFDGGSPAAASLGYELSSAINSIDNGITAPFFLRDGVPVTPQQPTLNDGYGAVKVGQNPTTAVNFFEENRRTGYSQQFNFGVQRELPGSILVDVSYLANLGRKLASPNLSLNQVSPDKLTTTSTQKDRPFPQFSNVLIQFPTLGVSAYHAFATKVEKRFSYGFNLLSTYTYLDFIHFQRVS